MWHPTLRKFLNHTSEAQNVKSDNFMDFLIIMVTEASILTLWPRIKLLQFRVQHSCQLTNQMANQWTTHWLSKPEVFQCRFPLHWRKLKGPFYSVTKMQGEQINVLKTVLSLKTIHDYPILVSNLSVLQIMILLLRKDNTGRHFSWANWSEKMLDIH